MLFCSPSSIPTWRGAGLNLPRDLHSGECTCARVTCAFFAMNYLCATDTETVAAGIAERMSALDE